MAKKSSVKQAKRSKPSTPKRKLDLAPPALFMDKDDLGKLNNILDDLKRMKTSHAECKSELKIAVAKLELSKAQIEQEEQQITRTAVYADQLANRFNSYNQHKETLIAEICEKTGIVVQAFSYNSETGEITLAP